MRTLIGWMCFRVFGIIFLLFVVWQFFIFFRERPLAFTGPETRAAQQVAAGVMADLKSKVDGPVRFGVAHFSGDRYEVVTDTMRSALSARSGWSVEEGSVIVKFLEDVGRALGRATSIEEVIQAGQKVELDVVVAGKVVRAETVNEEGYVEIQVQAYDVRKGEWLLRNTYAGKWKPTVLQKTAHGVTSVHPIWRFGGWLLFVLILPWTTSLVTHYALEQKNNVVSFMVVTGYTVIDMAAALLLVGFSLAGGLPWFKFLVAFLFCTAYNYWACERIAGKESAR